MGGFSGLSPAGSGAAGGSSMGGCFFGGGLIGAFHWGGSRRGAGGRRSAVSFELESVITVIVSS